MTTLTEQAELIDRAAIPPEHVTNGEVPPHLMSVQSVDLEVGEQYALNYLNHEKIVHLVCATCHEKTEGFFIVKDPETYYYAIACWDCFHGGTNKQRLVTVEQRVSSEGLNWTADGAQG